MVERSYPYMKTSKGVLFLVAILVIFFVFLLWYVFAVEFCESVWDVALQETVDSVRTGSIIMMVMTLVSAVGVGMYFFGGYNAHTIILSDRGVELQRNKGSILITKIENVVEKNPNALRLEGVTADGRPVRKMFAAGDMGKDHWPDFKRDVMALWQRPGQRPLPPPPPRS